MTGIIPDETQEGRILQLLKQSGTWVSARDLSEISLQYCARINGLRKRVFAIENKLEVSDSGRRRGFYRLKPLPAMPRSAPKPIRETEPQERLFSEAVRYRDPEEVER